VAPFASTSFTGGSQSTSQSQLQNLLSNFSTLMNYLNQSQQVTASPYAAPLAASGQADITAGIPLVQTSASQMLEALRTGGVNAFIPWISRAVDAVRQAGSTGVQTLRQGLARSGMGNTLGGQAAVAQAEQQAGQQAASTPANLIQNWIQQAPAYGAALTSAGRGGLAAAMPGAMTVTGKETGRQATTGTASEQINSLLNALQQINQYQTQRGVGTSTSTTTNQPSFWDMFNQSLMAGGALGAGAGGLGNIASAIGPYIPFLGGGIP
jgi:hypothetical protein